MAGARRRIPGPGERLGLAPRAPLVERGSHSARLGLAPAEAALARGAQHRAVFLAGAALATTVTTTTLGSSVEEPPGDLLDFDWGMGGKNLRAGKVVSTDQPWSEFVTITAVNRHPAHPDAAILLDWNAWIEGPPPPPGLNGRSASRTWDEDPGLLLVIPHDATDANGDGRVDVPTVESAGGTITFDFAGPARVPWLTLFDVDEDGGKLRSYIGATLIAEDTIPNFGDRSMQDVSVPGGYGGVTRIELELAGSAGVVSLVTIPCPAIINFDETSTGVPIARVAGQEVEGYDGLGLFGGFVTATNNDSSHPDVALLYDTGDPLAADPDLATPGTGAGNTVAHHKAVIIADNVVDANNDGIVDVPDDEKAGGTIHFGWVTSDVVFESVTVVDVDAGEVSLVRVFDQTINDWVEIPFVDLGNNSVQTVASSIGPTRQIEVVLGGSGAVLELRVCSDQD